MASKSSHMIPEEAFTTLGFMIPALARLIDRECDITLGSWLVLSEVKRRGRSSADGLPVLLRHDLTRLFDERGFTRPAITKILNSLDEKKLVKRRKLAPEERKVMFGSTLGSRSAVVLTPDGDRKIDEFKTILRSQFDEWYKQQPSVVRGALKGFRFGAVGLIQVLIKSKDHQSL